MDYERERRRQKRYREAMRNRIIAAVLLAGIIVGAIFIIKGCKKDDAPADDAQNTNQPVDNVGDTTTPDNVIVDDELLTLVNPWNPLPDDWTVDLVTLDDGHRVDSRCYEAYMEMINACKAAGYSPVNCSSYRTQETQQSLYDNKVQRLISSGMSEEEAKTEAAKAVAIPGYQVPFASREMPMPYGWGTGGIQVTASIIGRDDVLKVIDQGSDDTTNAVSIRRFFERTAAVTTTTHTGEASIIQTRHRIPEQPLREDQIMVYQVPMPEPLRWLEPSEKETRTLHALEEYGIMSIKLYEDIMRHGDIATGFDYPVKVNGRYIMSPSPIPRFDNPKMHQCPALQLFGAGREKRIYAIPPYTDVVSLDFEDYPFTPQSWDQCCAICGATDTYLDEIVMDDAGTRMFVCSDTDNCARRVAGQGGTAAPREEK